MRPRLRPHQTRAWLRGVESSTVIDNSVLDEELRFASAVAFAWSGLSLLDTWWWISRGGSQ